MKGIRKLMPLIGLLWIVGFGIWYFHEGVVNGSMPTKALHMLTFINSVGVAIGLYFAVIDHEIIPSWRITILPGLAAFPITFLLFVQTQTEPERIVPGFAATVFVAFVSALAFKPSIIIGAIMGLVASPVYQFASKLFQALLSGMKQ